MARKVHGKTIICGSKDALKLTISTAFIFQNKYDCVVVFKMLTKCRGIRKIEVAHPVFLRLGRSSSAQSELCG